MLCSLDDGTDHRAPVLRDHFEVDVAIAMLLLEGLALCVEALRELPLRDDTGSELCVIESGTLCSHPQGGEFVTLQFLEEDRDRAGPGPPKPDPGETRFT